MSGSSTEAMLSVTPTIHHCRLALGTALLVGLMYAAYSEEVGRIESYPLADSKKGLQVEIVDDALALDVDHAALNVNLSAIIAPPGATGSKALLVWENQDGVFRFDQESIERLDGQIKPLSDAGALVYLILLTYASGNEDLDRILLHPGYSEAAPNHLGAFNVATEEGRQWLNATIEFLAQRWSRSDGRFGRVVGYIVGNEVNSHWFWSNMGRVPFEEFARTYLQTVRLTHDAVRRHSRVARIYISLDHHWHMRYAGGDELQTFEGRRLIDYLAAEGSDVAWHVAYHPYPEDLFNPRFWQDKTAIPSPDTPRITFKNLQVLTDYLRRPALLLEGESRRVILSEQGFHTPDGPEGEAVQAAAYCYAYRIVNALDGIDAFILHRHVDHPHEHGLKLGLRRYTPGAAEPRPKKKIYDCFQAADTAEWEKAFQFALPIVGLDRWDVTP